MTTKLIGITSLDFHIPSKQDVLMFDEIGIGGLDENIAKLDDRKIVSDLEYLINQGIIFNAKYLVSPETKNNPIKNQLAEITTINALLSQMLDDHEEDSWKFYVDPENVQKILEGTISGSGINIDRVSDLVSEKAKEFQTLKNTSSTFNVSEYARLFDQSTTVSAVRLLSLHYSKNSSVNAIPLIQVPNFELIGDTEERDVTKLIISRLPIPSEETPLEALLDFRQDPDTRRRIMDLRLWMNNVRRKVNNGEVSYDEMEEQLDYLLHEYVEHMKLQKMKINTTTLETTFTMVASFVENLLKLKLEASVNSLFLLQHRKIALLEAERTAPGRQVAYVASATENFSGK